MTRPLPVFACVIALVVGAASAHASPPSRWKWKDLKGTPALGPVVFTAQHAGTGYVVAGEDALALWGVTLDSKRPVWTVRPAPPASVGTRARWDARGDTFVAVGGEHDNIPLQTGAQFKDNAWKDLPPLPQGRLIHTTTLLADGAIVVIGGRIADKPGTKGFDAPETASALWLAPGATSWTALPPLPEPRWLHTATALPDGSILVAGGTNEAREQGPDDALGLTPAWRLSADKKAWLPAGSLPTPRYGQDAILTAAGVLITGGEIDGVGSATDAVDLFDPKTSTWKALGRAPYAPSSHATCLLADGRVLVTGGSDVFTDGALPFTLDGAYVIDAARGTFSKVRKMPVGRSGHSVLVGKRGVLVLGGSSLPFKPDPDHYEKPWVPAPPRWLWF